MNQKPTMLPDDKVKEYPPTSFSMDVKRYDDTTNTTVKPHLRFKKTDGHLKSIFYTYIKNDVERNDRV